MAENLEYVKSVKKEYPTHSKYVVYDRLWIPSKKRNRDETKKIKIYPDLRPKETHIVRSLKRTKASINDIISCNNFDYFVTLTISPETQIDKYSYSETTYVIHKYLRSNIQRYILVPELHKSGAYHFHLLADIPKYDLKHFHAGIYNIRSYEHLGFSTAKKIKPDSSLALSGYLQKYITKDLLHTVPKGKKRFWSSKGLSRPIITYNEHPPKNSLPSYRKTPLSIYIVPH